MRSLVGSTWSKWDLHVHTPASLVHEYGGNDDATWERFIADLEALPPEFKVIGVNDYLFIDGYRRLRCEKAENGRLRNIDLLLPVIELRLAMFGGTRNALSRVNFHVIFSDALEPDLIDAQFIRALAQHYKLSHEHLALNWSAVPTRESVADLGRRIIESVPAEKRGAFGSPLSEGFNNLSFEPNQVREVLKSHYLQDHHLTAIGKTEWADIKWSDSSIASKKSIINQADFVFTAATSVDAYDNALAALRRENVCDRLMDCSDAHRFSNHKDKDRVGNCFTWIKADTSFEGLQHVRREFDRVFVGELPPKLELVRDAPSRFVRSISIRRTTESGDAPEWFDTSLEPSSDLVAVIGNKGSGKSALADILGLLGNASTPEYFSFLSAARFRHDRGQTARLFRGTMTFHSGEERSRTLDEDADPVEPQLIKYVPQRYLEQVCTEITARGTSTFDREILRVIFSHVPEDERLGFEDLEELLRYRNGEFERAMTQLRSRLHALNEEIVAAEERSHPEHQSALAARLAAKKTEIDQHQLRKPTAPPKPADTPESAQLREAIAELHEQTDATNKSVDAARLALDQTTRRRQILLNAVQRVKTAFKTVEDEKSELTEILTTFDLDVNQMLAAHLDTRLADEKLRELGTAKVELAARLDIEAVDSLPRRVRDLEIKSAALRTQLDEPQRRYQSYVSALATWTKRETELVGDELAPGSLKHLEQQTLELEALPSKLEAMRRKRGELSATIYSHLNQAAETYRQLYGYAQSFIAEHPILQGRELLTFAATIAESGFSAEFLSRIDKRTRSRFTGNAGEKTLDDMVEAATFSDWNGTKSFLQKIAVALQDDNRYAQEVLRKQQKLVDFYDFIFSLAYLRPQYSMELARKPLSALSPGERGTLLLVFYLLVDRADTPIVIDQPEDNLDNQTIYSLLVPCIRDAKERRQIVLVTHSPNLAVVCDAEQVVCASYHPDGVRLRYVSGSIENPEINAAVLRILEGTRPAFDNRRTKYQPFVR